MPTRLSIIVPVYNAAKTIEQCLNSLLNQSYDSDYYEIICVNDGSTDRSLEIIKGFSEGDNIIVISQENSGPAKARNVGARKAGGEILLFTDSDCELDGNWVSEMVRPFDDPDVSGVQGGYKTRQKGVIARYEQINIESSYKYFKTNNQLDTIGTYSAAYPRKLFLDFGGFKENYKAATGEDFDFSYMLSREGYKFVFNENAVCYHRHPEKLLGYMLVKYKRGFWRAVMYKNNKDKIAQDSYTPVWDKIQLLSVVLFFVSLPFNLINGNFHYASLIFIIIYFGLSIRFITFAMQKNLRVAILSPFITFVRSVFFTAGMAAGIVYILTGRIK